MIDEAPPVLEDDDVLEMVNAGLAPITVVDDYLAEFWNKVFPNIKVHRNIPCAPTAAGRRISPGQIPRLRRPPTSGSKHGKGTALRNVIEGRISRARVREERRG